MIILGKDPYESIYQVVGLRTHNMENIIDVKALISLYHRTIMLRSIYYDIAICKLKIGETLGELENSTQTKWLYSTIFRNGILLLVHIIQYTIDFLWCPIKHHLKATQIVQFLFLPLLPNRSARRLKKDNKVNIYLVLIMMCRF